MRFAMRRNEALGIARAPVLAERDSVAADHSDGFAYIVYDDHMLMRDEASERPASRSGESVMKPILMREGVAPHWFLAA
jgi:hypothetical protein